MREILFRAKGYDGWKEGDLIHEPFGIYIQSVKGRRRIKTKVDPETIYQYTGLTDKNGRKIFEGDILLYIDRECPDGTMYEQVIWNGFSWGTKMGKRETVITKWECENMEVAGNIFDNPELMKIGG